MTITRKLYQFGKPYKDSFRLSSPNKNELKKRYDWLKRRGYKPTRIGKLWKKPVTFAFSYKIKKTRKWRKKRKGRKK